MHKRSNDSRISEPEDLDQEYDLTGDRLQEIHYYTVQTTVAMHSNNGILKRTDHYREQLIVEPGVLSAGEPDRFTCNKFTVRQGDGPEVSIPSLEGLSYTVDKTLLDKNGIGEKGQLYGVPEEMFEGLVDSTGKKLPFEIGYQVYSVFFYYHAYSDYAEPTREGKGVQHLNKIGDDIILDGSYAESPIPGKLAKKNSIWKNGEIVLEFKGLGNVDGRRCAIIGIDSGVCRWNMPMTYMPIMNLKTTGVSNYQGDLYLDLNSKWVRKISLILSEATKTTMWGIPVDKSMPRTELTIRSVSEGFA